MLTTSNTHLIHPEATTVASALPCWDESSSNQHSFDPKRRLGYVPALAGRYAR
jgi:hypothetical protein